MRDDSVNCEALRRALRDDGTLHGGRGLTNEQLAHLEGCDECMDAWLTLALEEKPEVSIPADFAARVAASLPPRRERRVAMTAQRHWGVRSAIAVSLVVLMVCFAGAKPANSWVGLVFLILVATEIAGLALWLGPRWTGR